VNDRTLQYAMEETWWATMATTATATTKKIVRGWLCTGVRVGEKVQKTQLPRPYIQLSFNLRQTPPHDSLA
jgi:hypothetical protein